MQLDIGETIMIAPTTGDKTAAKHAGEFFRVIDTHFSEGSKEHWIIAVNLKNPKTRRVFHLEDCTVVA